MTTAPMPPALPGSRLAENIMHFARTLRAAGLPAGPGTVLAAIRAVRAVGVHRRDDFYWALHAVFVSRREQQELFDQTFQIFWRNPQILRRMLALLLPDVQPTAGSVQDSGHEVSRRVAEALRTVRTIGDGARHERKDDELEIDAVLTYSDREVLRRMDFEQMSAAEVAQAKAAIAAMRLPILRLPTRRFRPAPAGNRADLRATMRALLRSGGDTIPLRWKQQQRRHPPLVVICDISGSMSRYSRMLLHFLHAVTSDRDRVFSFVFGTRLTNVTRHLRHKDIDVALEKVAAAVEDWAGGTRIGACLRDFNQTWSRRVLAQGAVALFISDGLDRDNAAGLRREIERLHRSCRRLIWLNPLLRYEGYEPKSLGAKAIVPHVDEVRTVHNLDSLEQLAAVLSEPIGRRQEATGPWSEITA